MLINVNTNKAFEELWEKAPRYCKMLAQHNPETYQIGEEVAPQNVGVNSAEAQPQDNEPVEADSTQAPTLPAENTPAAKKKPVARKTATKKSTKTPAKSGRRPSSK